MFVFTATSKREEKSWMERKCTRLASLPHVSSLFDVFSFHKTLNRTMFIFFSSNFLDFSACLFLPSHITQHFKRHYSQNSSENIFLNKYKNPNKHVKICWSAYNMSWYSTNFMGMCSSKFWRNYTWLHKYINWEKMMLLKKWEF